MLILYGQVSNVYIAFLIAKSSCGGIINRFNAACRCDIEVRKLRAFTFSTKFSLTIYNLCLPDTIRWCCMFCYLLSELRYEVSGSLFLRCTHRCSYSRGIKRPRVRVLSCWWYISWSFSALSINI